MPVGPVSIPIAVKITSAGQIAAANVSSTGIRLDITHVGVGTGAYTPTGAETQLQNRLLTVPIAGGGGIEGTSEYRIHTALKALLGAGFAVWEIGFYVGDPAYGGFLLALASRTDKKYFDVSDEIIVTASYTLGLSALPANSVNVIVDQNYNAMLQLIGNHEINPLAHPQYVSNDQLAAALVSYSITILKRAYPVGSVFSTSDTRNPSVILGFGTWQAIVGRNIVGVDVTKAAYQTVNKSSAYSATGASQIDAGIIAPYITKYIWERLADTNTDTTPNAFTFVDTSTDTGVGIFSNVVIISGIDAPTSFSITGLTASGITAGYKINGGTLSANPGATVENGDTVQLYIFSNTPGTYNLTVTIGGVSDTWTTAIAEGLDIRLENDQTEYREIKSYGSDNNTGGRINLDTNVHWQVYGGVAGNGFDYRGLVNCVQISGDGGFNTERFNNVSDNRTGRFLIKSESRKGTQYDKTIKGTFRITVNANGKSDFVDFTVEHIYIQASG